MPAKRFQRIPSRTAPAKPDVTLPACIVGVFGSPGAGKSAYIKQRLMRESGPCIVFDPGGEYTRGTITQVEAFAYATMNEGHNQDVTFRPAPDPQLRLRQFSRFCFAGLALAQAHGRCLVVIDELHLFTAAGAAPAGWNDLVLTGRKHGVAIIAASVRPAAVDKDFWTCCTLVHSGRLLFEDDQRTVARALGVEAAELRDLKSPPGAPGCDWIERDMLTGETRRGRLTF